MFWCSVCACLPAHTHAASHCAAACSIGSGAPNLVRYVTEQAWQFVSFYIGLGCMTAILYGGAKWLKKDVGAGPA
jgi:hypothetical protein